MMFMGVAPRVIAHERMKHFETIGMDTPDDYFPVPFSARGGGFARCFRLLSGGKQETHQT